MFLCHDGPVVAQPAAAASRPPARAGPAPIPATPNQPRTAQPAAQPPQPHLLEQVLVARLLPQPRLRAGRASQPATADSAAIQAAPELTCLNRYSRLSCWMPAARLRWRPRGVIRACSALTSAASAAAGVGHRANTSQMTLRTWRWGTREGRGGRGGEGSGAGQGARRQRARRVPARRRQPRAPWLRPARASTPSRRLHRCRRHPRQAHGRPTQRAHRVRCGLVEQHAGHQQLPGVVVQLLLCLGGAGWVAGWVAGKGVGGSGRQVAGLGGWACTQHESGPRRPGRPGATTTARAPSPSAPSRP